MNTWEKFRAMSWLKQGVIVIVVLLLVFGFLGCVTSTSNPSTTATPTVTPDNSVASTPAPVVSTPQAQPSAKSTSVTPLTSDQLSTLNSGMEAKGYTIVDPLAQKGSTPDGYPIYQGLMTKAGTTYGFTIVQTDSSSHATAEMAIVISTTQGLGYSGTTQSDGSWYGTMTSSDGNLMGAYIMLGSDNEVIQVLGE